MEIDTAAPVITRDEIVIHAPIQTIWDIQTDVAGWPAWQPEVDGAQSDGPLAVGSVFRWQTAGLDITSTVEEVDPPHRIVWGGPAQGIVAVHVWTLEERDDGVLVHTEESWDGEPVRAQVEMLQGALDASLRADLEDQLPRQRSRRHGRAAAQRGRDRRTPSRGAPKRALRGARGSRGQPDPALGA